MSPVTSSYCPMNVRFFLQTATALVISTSLAQDKPATTSITLRALLDMIEEPAAVATDSILTRGQFISEEDKAVMRLTISSPVFESWMEAARFLAVPPKEGEEPVEVFPPGLRNAIKAEPELQLKREHLQLSLDRLRQLCESRATAGEKPEKRLVEVPEKWLEAFDKAREQFVLKLSSEFIAGHRGELAVIRMDQGTHTRNADGNLVKVANAEVPEESEVFCAPYGKGGTWNLYQLINRPATWLEAEREASQMPAPHTDRKLTGHLVSIHSYAENQFVLRMIRGIPKCWIGLNDRRIEAHRDGNGSWEWSSGELGSYRNWKSGEPDSGTSYKTPFEEDGVLMYTGSKPEENGLWGDFPDGSREGRNHRYPYVVEWSVQAPEPIRGAQLLPAFFSGDIDGPSGDDGAFGVRFVYDAGGCSSLRSALVAYQSGKGRVVEAKLPMLHHRDPNGDDCSLLFPDAQPYPGHKEKGADHNLTVFCRGRIRIPEAATYTFGIAHDDGFAMRIKGQRWKSATGTGVIDPGDSSTVLQYWPFGQARTHAVIDLPAGDHELEFFGFQGIGDTYFELYTAKGAFEHLHETTTWRLVGHQSRGEVGVPGIAAPGWTVEVAPPGSVTRNTYDGAQRTLDRQGRKLTEPVQQIDYLDPDSPGQLLLRDSVPFPDGINNADDNQFAIRARGILEIPKDGTYWLGHASTRGGRLTLQGQPWKRLVLRGQGVVIDEDIIEQNPDSEWGWRAVGEVELKAGRYPIEFLGLHGKGAAGAEITAGIPFGPQLYLKAGSSKVEADLPGLSLVK